MSNRQDKEREEALQPERLLYAESKIRGLGIEIVNMDKTKIQFLWKNSICTIYPYSGWHTGKSINDGRGIENLLNQLKTK